MGWAEGLWVCWCREVGPWVPEKNVGSPVKLELQINNECFFKNCVSLLLHRKYSKGYSVFI